MRTVGLASVVHGDALKCATCHTMHYSQQHDYSGNSGSGTLSSTPQQVPLSGSGPYVNLLRDMGNTLCLACHDAQTGMPDVLGSDENELTERSAGFFSTTSPDFKGHNLHEPTAQDPDAGYLCTRCHFGGTFATATVECVDCHDPHGREPDNNLASEYRYRNLWWASYKGHEPPIKAFVESTATGLDVYEQANIRYPAPNSDDWREVTNICLDCHHIFSGYGYTREGGVEDGGCVRHPVTDSERGAQEPVDQGGETDPAHWLSVRTLPFIVTGASDYTKAAAPEAYGLKSEVFCLTCHKAHGSDQAFALRWDYSSMTASDGCQQCHNK